MLPPGPSITGVNDARLNRARRWGDYNFAPSKPLYRQPEALEGDEERSKALRQMLERVGAIGPGDGADGRLRPRAPGLPELTATTHIQLHARAAIGARAAASRGPFGAPWRIIGGYILQANNAAGTGWTLTASSYDATGTTDAVVGDRLLDFATVGNVSPPELGYFQESDIATTSPRPIFPRGQIMPPGTFCTLWVSATAAAVSAAAGTLVAIEELRGVQFNPGPDLELVLSRLRRRQPAPPPQRTANPGPPAAVRVSGPGFSRVIPWQLLAPELKREYVVNQFNGKPTPGIMPV